jgi:hypothetical protein
MLLAGICDATVPNLDKLYQEYQNAHPIIQEDTNTSVTSSDVSQEPQSTPNLDYTYINGNLYPYKIEALFELNTSDTRIKSFESYKLFNHNSKQYQLQQMCYTDDRGLRYLEYDGIRYYCCAVGSAVSVNIGQLGYLILEDGSVVNIVVSDVKDDRDTDNRNLITMHNLCCSEFVVDVNALDRDWKRMGCVFYECGNVCEIGVFDGSFSM